VQCSSLQAEVVSMRGVVEHVSRTPNRRSTIAEETSDPLATSPPQHVNDMPNDSPPAPTLPLPRPAQRNVNEALAGRHVETYIVNLDGKSVREVMQACLQYKITSSAQTTWGASGSQNMSNVKYAMELMFAMATPDEEAVIKKTDWSDPGETIAILTRLNDTLSNRLQALFERNNLKWKLSGPLTVSVPVNRLKELKNANNDYLNANDARKLLKNQLKDPTLIPTQDKKSSKPPPVRKVISTTPPSLPQFATGSRQMETLSKTGSSSKDVANAVVANAVSSLPRKRSASRSNSPSFSKRVREHTDDFSVDALPPDMVDFVYSELAACAGSTYDCDRRFFDASSCIGTNSVLGGGVLGFRTLPTT
jgi:hypothetical protein